MVYGLPVSRRRVLLMLWMPFIALSLLPLALIPLISTSWGFWVLHLILIHAASCCGDFLTLFRIYTQVPSPALVHNKGWKTYWKVPEPGIQ